MKNKLYKFFWVLHSSSFGCSGFVSLPLHEQTKLHPCAHFCSPKKSFHCFNPITCHFCVSYNIVLLTPTFYESYASFYILSLIVSDFQ